MTHRTLDQLHQMEAEQVERLKATRAEIRSREELAMTKLAKSYAKAITVAVKASGGAMPTPEALAALLAVPGAAEAPPRPRRPSRPRAPSKNRSRAS